MTSFESLKCELYIENELRFSVNKNDIRLRDDFMFDEDRIVLQGLGVAIVLQSDGTWYFEDTSGG